ncbi:perforin-1-like [Myripristis murdjan]|uniref:perforin-1-like n=1 Tax=Myripristis murdjan TaxID=586833 RepID=UPI0011761622|nr:perforin-1-like [Myripristis murdjan]
MKLALFAILLVIVVVQPQGTSGYYWKRRSATVYVDCGRGLRGDGILGKTDGYVKVKIGRRTLSTKVINNNNNPNWFTYLRFGTTYSRIGHVEIWDKDSGFWWNRDDLLGRCYFYMYPGRRTLTCRLRHGFVRFSYTYV